MVAYFEGSVAALSHSNRTLPPLPTRRIDHAFSVLPVALLVFSNGAPVAVFPLECCPLPLNPELDPVAASVASPGKVAL